MNEQYAQNFGLVMRWLICRLPLQAQDNILFTGKLEEYEAAFNLVDTEGKGAFLKALRTASLIGDILFIDMLKSVWCGTL